MEYKKSEFLAGKDKITAELREDFIKEYSSKQGWKVEELTTEQMKEIKSQQGYKNPNMLCS